MIGGSSRDPLHHDDPRRHDDRFGEDGAEPALGRQIGRIGRHHANRERDNSENGKL